MQRGTSLEHVASVLAIEDRVLRNYWVTQSYSDLASSLAALLDPDTANWCTFGTWASCTVGRNLRGEDLPEWLQRRVVLDDGMMGAVQHVAAPSRWGHFTHRFHDVTPDEVAEAVKEAFGSCAMNLSNGNTEVFGEIGPVAATFITVYGELPSADEGARAGVLAACDGAPEFEGVNHLAAGFSLWCDALNTTDPIRRSQLILAGSLHLGTHEQHHLQAAIAGSMDMGINQSIANLKQRLAKEGRDPDKADAALDEALHPVAHGVGDVWGDLMTELLGTIVTPDGTMRLDHDVPAAPGQAFLSPDVSTVVVDDLTALLARFNRADAEGRDSRAIDWVSMDDRMNFITNLFRSRHHRMALFEPPFTPEVLADIEADTLPGEPAAAAR
jgi:hypothetical protein